MPGPHGPAVGGGGGGVASTGHLPDHSRKPSAAVAPTATAAHSRRAQGSAKATAASGHFHLAESCAKRHMASISSPSMKSTSAASKPNSMPVCA